MKRLIASTLIGLGACACGQNPMSPTALTLASVQTMETKAVASQAVSLRFTWILDGVTTQLPQHNGTVNLPVGHTAILKVQGLDAGGRLSPISSQVFEASGTWFHVGGINPSASQTNVIANSDTPSPYDPVVLTADADPGPGESFIWGHIQVRIVR